MRVTFLLPRYGWQPSGGFAVVYIYAGLLAERGHDVEVIHPRRLPPGGWEVPSGLYNRLHYAGGRLRDRLFTPRLEWARPDPRVRLRYVPELSAEHVPDADAVIATWWSTAEAALALPPAKGARYHLIQGYGTWSGAEDRVHAVWRAPLHKIFIARWLLTRALELGVPESMTTLIPNAVDLGVFRVQRPIDSRGPSVAMLYSSQSYKGGDIGLEILRRVRQQVPALTAVLFGVGRAPAGLPSWIRYIRRAKREQLAVNVYNEAAVYLCPSISEGWHLPPAEAMACGCALVASDIGGVHDYAVDGETALLFEPGDVPAGTELVTQLLIDRERRARLARRGLTKIETFSWERSASLLAGLLQQHHDSGTLSPLP
jgi:glycosyltransferase involved in cell wall biosynthesis